MMRAGNIRCVVTVMMIFLFLMIKAEYDISDSENSGVQESYQNEQTTSVSESVVTCDPGLRHVQTEIDIEDVLDVQVCPKPMEPNHNLFVHFECEAPETEVFVHGGLHPDYDDDGSLNSTQFYSILEVEQIKSSPCRRVQNKGENCIRLKISFRADKHELNGTSFHVCAKRTRGGLRNVCYDRKIRIMFLGDHEGTSYMHIVCHNQS